MTLGMTQLIGFGSGGNPASLIDAIVSAGLTTNLKLCLDAGDILSYPAGGNTKWLDRSGGGYDFFKGTDSGTTGDPTFNGVAGNLSVREFFNYDGADDVFKYDSANETWMGGSTSGGMHHNSAKFSAIMGIHVPASVTNGVEFFSTINFAGGFDQNDVGINYRIRSDVKAQITIANGSGSSWGLNVIADSAVSLNANHFIGVTIDEAAGTGFLYLDGAPDQVSASDTFTSTYTLPSSSAAGAVMQMGSSLNSSYVADAGFRPYFKSIWVGTALTTANFDTLFATMRGRLEI